MSWNYRVVRRPQADPDEPWWYGIHEAYYHEDGACWAITEDAVGIESDTLNGLLDCWAIMSGALTKPVLDYETREEV